MSKSAKHHFKKAFDKFMGWNTKGCDESNLDNYPHVRTAMQTYAEQQALKVLRKFNDAMADSQQWNETEMERFVKAIINPPTL